MEQNYRNITMLLLTPHYYWDAVITMTIYGIYLFIVTTALGSEFELQ